MLETIKTAVAWLTAIDPALPRALLVGVVLLAVWLLRKLFPRTWEWFARAVPVSVIDPAPALLVLSKAWQALPGAVLGAVALSFGNGGDVREAVRGAVYGALAALAHEVLKAVPWIPYQGAVGKLKPPTLPVLMLLVPAVALAALSHLGCSSSVDPGQRIKTALDSARAACLAYQAARSELPKPLPAADKACPLLLSVELVPAAGEGAAGVGGAP